MTIEVGVIERLLSVTAVTAIASTRVYQLKLPQRPTLPAVRVQLIGESERQHLRGVENLLRTRIQVDAFAEESSGADPYHLATGLADAIHGDWQGVDPPNGLSGWRGTVGGSPPTLEIVAISRIDREVVYEPNELRLVRVRQDYHVWWKRL